MAFTAAVYQVLVASPSDTSEERKRIPQALHQWNLDNAEHYRVVFVPLRWETHTFPEMGVRPQEAVNRQLIHRCDLLIGTFWTRLGTNTGKAESGTVEEIQEFLKAGKPVMLYFSSAPVDLDSVDLEQYGKLKEFRKSCRGRGLVEEYRSVDELEAKVRAQLTQWVRSEPAGTGSVSPEEASAVHRTGELKALKAKLISLVRRLRAEWIAERDSKPFSFEDAGHILAKLSSALSDFYAAMSELIPEKDLQPLTEFMTEIKKARQQLKVVTHDFDSRGFWDFGSNILDRIENYAANLKDGGVS